jgi:3-oxoacyl-[acyl-carrier protein] reductase
MGRLEGRVALVTGGGRGFGRAIALAMGREGADIAVNYRTSAGPAGEVVRELESLGRRGLSLQADVGREDAVRAMVEAVLSRFGRLDILVNNAGVMIRAPYVDAPIEHYAEMFATNVTGTMLCSHHALPAMVRQRHGRIINLSSQLARLGSVGGGGFAAYAATKGAVEALTRALAHEFGSHGITVNAIAPGGIETDMSRDVMTPEYRAGRMQELAVRRFGTVEDVAGAAVFLAADQGGFLTGQVLHPSGGAVMA